MRLALVAVTVATIAGCDPDDDRGNPTDARPIDAYVRPPPPMCPGPPGYVCGQSCGNNTIETMCWVDVRTPMDSCAVWTPNPSYPPEACDGTATPTCTDLGFAGGTTTCVNCSTVDTTACEMPAKGHARLE